MTSKKILILFYSMGGGTALLAKELAEGAKEVPNTTVQVKRVPEIIPDKLIKQMPRQKEIIENLNRDYEEAAIEDLAEADGVAFGTPVHFGSFASQMKQFIDQLSPVWMQKRLVNKPASVFCVSGSLHGGEELTLISLMVPLLNLGMIPIGIPYPLQDKAGFDAGSPYGAIFVNKEQLHSDLPQDVKTVARILGKRLATTTHLLSCECQDCQNLSGPLISN